MEYFVGSYEEFFEQFIFENRPCLIPKVTDDWCCMKTWVKNDLPDIEYLKENYGKVTVEVSNCDERYFNAQCKTTMSLSEFVIYWKDYMSAYSDSKQCLYMKDWHFMRDFPDDDIYTVPKYFRSDWLNEYYTSRVDINDDYRFVYMGPKHSWTPFHADVFTSYSWSVNICGQKKWLLFPPGEENKLKDKLGNLPYNINLDDLERRKFELDVKFFVYIQNVGEAIFVPSGWFHQVWNMKDTISINHNWINGGNIGRVWKSLKANLQLVKEEIRHIKEDCDHWERQCQMILKSCFGIDYEVFYTFLNHIMKCRLQRLQSKNQHCVCSKLELGSTRHTIFDLEKAQQVSKYLLRDADCQHLDFCIKEHV